MLKSILANGADTSGQVRLNNFNNGKYDDVAFSETPSLTDDLKLLIKMDNRAFIYRLFLKCNSDSCISFWLKSGRAQLPKDVLAMALAMHNNIYVVRYLKKEGFYDNLSNEEKSEFLLRSQNFIEEASKYGEGSRFLRNEFTKPAPKFVI